MEFLQKIVGEKFANFHTVSREFSFAVTVWKNTIKRDYYVCFPKIQHLFRQINIFAQIKYVEVPKNFVKMTYFLLRS